jgi:hypothetical protein
VYGTVTLRPVSFHYCSLQYLPVLVVGSQSLGRVTQVQILRSPI